MIFEVIKYIKKKMKKYIKNQKKINVEKSEKKSWPNTNKEQKFKVVSKQFFLHYLGCTLSDCIIILSGKILELEIF